LGEVRELDLRHLFFVRGTGASLRRVQRAWQIARCA